MKRQYYNYSFLNLVGLILTLILWCQPVFAEVSAQLSKSTTSLDEPVKLSLQIKGDNDATPDLSPLEKNFEILGRSQQQNISIINGHMSKTRGLNLTLLPKALGKINIPPIPVGNEASQPLILQVVESLTLAGDSAEASAFIQLELSQTKAYLQQEVLLTVRLYQADGVRGESLAEPQASLPDTLVKLLHEEQYQAEHEGKSYRVVERRYAVYAYQTGPLQLGEIRYRGRSGSASRSIFNLMRDPFSNNLGESRIVRANSDPVTLEILPVPTAFSGKRWLPARNLQIVESGLSEADGLTAGKPVTRRIMLFADGLMAAQLPSIELEIPAGVKQYPERPQNKDNESRDGVSGSRQTSVTLVATEPGSYDLPAIEIPWWNTQTDREEIARLPAVSMQVMPAIAGSNLSKPQQTALEIPAESTESAASNAEEQFNQSSVESSPFPGWLVWLLGTGWLVTLVGWWLSHRRKPQAAVTPVTETEPEESPVDELSAILADLDRAYAEKDREAARLAWLRWGQYRWPENPPGNLNRLAERSTEKITLAVIALDRAFYSPGHQEGWGLFNPHELLQQSKPRRAQPIERGKLIPLNP